MKVSLRRALVISALICAVGALGTGLAEADSTGALSNTATPGFTSSTPFPSASSAIFPVASGPINVVLPALKSNAAQGGATPAVERPINCQVDLNEWVHYSAPGNDTSWHWSWACDGPVNLNGSQALYDEGYPIETSGVHSSGVENIENIRYNGCVGATWFGQASGTFTAPDHGPASFAGGSPNNVIRCP